MQGMKAMLLCKAKIGRVVHSKYSFVRFRVYKQCNGVENHVFMFNVTPCKSTVYAFSKAHYTIMRQSILNINTTEIPGS